MLQAFAEAAGAASFRRGMEQGLWGSSADAAVKALNAVVSFQEGSKK